MSPLYFVLKRLRLFITAMMALSLISALLPVCVVNASAGQKLREVAEPRSFYMGAALNSLHMNDTSYTSLASQQYNMAVPESCMKMKYLMPSEGVFDFSSADTIVRFARDNNMAVRGHTLVWHHMLPAWLRGKQLSKSEAETLLQSYIKTVVSHFAAKFPNTVRQWDVVNEAVERDPVTGRYGLRPSIWLSSIGPDYNEKALRWAREADPEAKLYYNDYGIEVLPDFKEKIDVVRDLLSDLTSKGVPVDGVGFQCHAALSHAGAVEGLGRAMDVFIGLGLDVMVTELDVKINQDDTGVNPDKLNRQAALYGDILSQCLDRPQVKGLCTWGFTDRVTWIANDFPLPFDENLAPKPAFQIMYDLLRQGGQHPKKPSALQLLRIDLK